MHPFNLSNKALDERKGPLLRGAEEGVSEETPNAKTFNKKIILYILLGLIPVLGATFYLGRMTSSKSDSNKEQVAEKPRTNSNPPKKTVVEEKSEKTQTEKSAGKKTKSETKKKKYKKEQVTEETFTPQEPVVEKKKKEVMPKRPNREDVENNAHMKNIGQ